MAIKDDMEDVQEAVINELITENGITNTLADGQVTETKIANGAVTAAKLGNDVDLTVADGSVTPDKLDRAYLESTGGIVSGELLVGTTSNTMPTAAAAGQGIMAGTRTFIATETSGDTILGGTTGSNFTAFYQGGTERMRIQSNGTIKINNSSTPLTPSGGGVIYVYNGALYFRGSSGTITQLASA